MDLNELIFGNPIILENILNKYPAKYLLEVKKVNKFWTSVINSILEKRSRISCALYAFRENSLLEQYISLNYLDLIAETLPIYPDFAIFIISYNLYAQCYKINESGEPLQIKPSLFNYLKLKMPADCIILYIITDGVIGTSYDPYIYNNGKYSTCSTFEYESSQSFSSYLFSTRNHLAKDKYLSATKSKRLNFEMLDIPRKDIKHFINHKNKSKCKFDLAKYFSNKRHTDFPFDARCVLFFADSIIETQILRKILIIIRDTYESNNSKIKIIGALVDGLDILTNNSHTFRNREDSHRIKHHKIFERLAPSILLIFLRGEQIKDVLLEIIPSSCIDQISLGNRIKHLKNSYNALASTFADRHLNPFAFMFSCIGRGKHIYSWQQNVESLMFHSYFPDVPIVGLFGNGEIAYQSPGCQTYDADKVKTSNKSFEDEPKVGQSADNHDDAIPRNDTILYREFGYKHTNDPQDFEQILNLAGKNPDSIPGDDDPDDHRSRLILDEMTQGDRDKKPKLTSAQFIYYYSTIFCVVVIDRDI
ncbi:unnamed protein product [Gordionus sp. m RMFG-2023]|uniref:uncharacterized protein LOC135923779 n=1 Tax=Gordionus sp. m RMFG-2023 TaxID=3053472 RepID=UPI0030DFBE27